MCATIFKRNVVTIQSIGLACPGVWGRRGREEIKEENRSGKLCNAGFT